MIGPTPRHSRSTLRLYHPENIVGEEYFLNKNISFGIYLTFTHNRFFFFVVCCCCVFVVCLFFYFLKGLTAFLVEKLNTMIALIGPVSELFNKYKFKPTSIYLTCKSCCVPFVNIVDH